MKQLLLARTSLHCNALLPLPFLESETSCSFLVGQYELVDEGRGADTRAGQIDLTSLEFASPSSGFTCSTKSSLRLPNCGVFDIVPIQSSHSQQLQQQSVAAGCTDGTVKIINVSSSSASSSSSSVGSLSMERSFQMGEEMVTSCFAFHQPSSEAFFIASTHHQGTISVHRSPSSSELDSSVFSFQAHEFDAWSIAPSIVDDNSKQQNPDVFFSGGDDGKLKLWDLRAKIAGSSGDSDDGTTTAPPTCQSHCGGFEAGVVSIAPQSSNVLLVGSYDENVYAVDARMLAPGGGSGKNRGVGDKNSIVSKLALSGGAWRLREISQRTVNNFFLQKDDGEGDAVNIKSGKTFFAVPAMQGGCEVFSFHPLTNELENVCWPGSLAGGGVSTDKRVIHDKAMKHDETTEIEPLIYDVCQLGAAGRFLGGGSATFATVSFYTNELRCWGV